MGELIEVHVYRHFTLAGVVLLEEVNTVVAQNKQIATAVETVSQEDEEDNKVG
jgi:hypothetical protein